MADTTNRLEPDPRGRKGRDRPMRGFKGPRSAAWVCRAHDDLAGASPDRTFNRWIGDFFSGVTYLNTELGIDLSAIGGVTLNGYNPATDYHSGTELHFDVAASKYLTKDLSVGVIASHYQQVSPDTGRGATVGPFKGRDSAIGGTVGYTFKIGELPISTRVKVLREFDVKNRLHGTVGWLSVSFPLWVQAKSAEAPQIN